MKNEKDPPRVSTCRIFAKVCESTREKCERLPVNLRQEILIYENNNLKLPKYNHCFKYIFLLWYLGMLSVIISNQQGVNKVAILNQQRCPNDPFCMFQQRSNKGVKTEGMNKVGHTSGWFNQLHVIQQLWSEWKAIFLSQRKNQFKTWECDSTSMSVRFSEVTISFTFIHKYLHSWCIYRKNPIVNHWNVM